MESVKYTTLLRLVQNNNCSILAEKLLLASEYTIEKFEEEWIGQAVEEGHSQVDLETDEDLCEQWEAFKRELPDLTLLKDEKEDSFGVWMPQKGLMIHFPYTGTGITTASDLAWRMQQ